MYGVCLHCRAGESLNLAQGDEKFHTLSVKKSAISKLSYNITKFAENLMKTDTGFVFLKI
jgi:hypothetical protein